ncbi:MAG: GIY-YIG nuclease family protein [Desulfobacterales bacterium]|nr:GIY-YIG nuclease family protein [Desulfobacterales bacterium]
MQNTLYIAEPIFSQKLQRFDTEASFPPVKKIGITTNHPSRREKELLGTVSPVKLAIVKAWTDIEARKVESMLHTILDNSRLDGEYFWDGNESLVEAVSDFIEIYHPEAKEIKLSDDADVMDAAQAIQKKSSQRIYTEAVPKLDDLGIEYNVIRNGEAVTFSLGEYRVGLYSNAGGHYTFTIWSKTKTTEEALTDFIHSRELSANSSKDSDRRARIPMASLRTIFDSISNFIKNDEPK